MKPSLFLSVLVALALAGPFLICAAEDAGRTAPSDVEVTRSVEKTLRYDPRVHAEEITVATEGGIVTLTGRIDNLPMKRYAVELAETRRGVQSIIDRLEVELERLDDELVQHSLNQALAVQSGFFQEGAEAIVNDGVVRLVGKVGSFSMSDLAERTAESVRGVRSVVNSLHIAPSQSREDGEILQHIELALRDDPWVDSDLITTTVDGGVVTMSGTVGSLAGKRRLREAASVAGVTRIDQEKLTVDGGQIEPDARKAEPVRRSDGEIQQAVGWALESDPRLYHGKVKIDVTGGVVSLRGEVSSLAAKQAALADAKNSPGVSQVYDYLEIRPADKVPDPALEVALQAVVDADVHLTDTEIDVTVEDGTVVLNGAVDTEFQWRHAEKHVAAATGVTAVENRLRILWPVPEAYRDLLSESTAKKGAAKEEIDANADPAESTPNGKAE